MARRRLAWERSWFAVVLALVGVSFLGYYCAEVGVRGLEQGDFLLPLLALPVVLLLLRRGFTGSRSKRQLWVDVPAGTFVLANGDVHELDQLGAVSIEKKYQRRADKRPYYLHQLKVASIEGPQFSSVFEGEVQRRQAALEAAIVQSAVRRVLERPQGEGAFRAGPEVATDVLARAGSRDRAIAALRALATDDDESGIRASAAKLAAELEARP